MHSLTATIMTLPSTAVIQAYVVRRTKRHLYRLWSITTRRETLVRFQRTPEDLWRIRWDQFVRLGILTTGTLTDLTTDLVVANKNNSTTEVHHSYKKNHVAALTSCDLLLRHAITDRPRCSTSGCTPSLIGSSPTTVWPPSLLSLTIAGRAAMTVVRAVQCPRFSFATMKSFGAMLSLRLDALPVVNHMCGMQYQIVLNLTFCAKIQLIQLLNLCAQLLHKTQNNYLHSKPPSSHLLRYIWVKAVI